MNQIRLAPIASGFLALALLISASPADAKAKARGPASAIKTSRAKVQVGGDAPIYIPSPKKVQCSEKVFITGRATLAQRVKDGESKRGLRELERHINTSCNQLPSKYVRVELNLEYFHTVAHMATVKFDGDDARGCLKLVEPITRPDSATNYAELGFEGSEPPIAAIEAIEAKCLQATGRAMTRAEPLRRPAIFEPSDE